VPRPLMPTSAPISAYERRPSLAGCP
jgi:hypothetical protein